MCHLTKFWLRYLTLKTQDTILLFSWELIWEDEKNRNLNNLIQKLFCSTSKVPIWTRMIFRNTIKRSRMFHQLLLTQNVQISIVFLSVKSIIIEIKDSNHLSLTSNISAKTWSNWTCRGYFENVRTSRSVPGFEIWPRFVGVKEQNKICNSFCQYCKSIYQCSEIIFTSS